MIKERNAQLSVTAISDGEQDGQSAVSCKKLPASDIYQSILRDYPDVLDVSQVSAIFGVSSKTVYRLLNDGSLASLKVGRAFKIPKLYVLQYINVLDRVE